MSSFASPEMLEAMFNNELETQFSMLRDEMRAMVPELETVKKQQAEMLRKQALQGDMLAQVQESINAALAFSAPLASEGIEGPQVSLFLGARGRFQSALLNNDFRGAETALSEMKKISANGNTYRVSEMALRAAKKDFVGAELVAKTIVGFGADSPRLQRVKKSLIQLTQAKNESSNTQKNPNVSKKYIEGDKVGDKGWTLTALIGRGGMGSVWRAQNSRGQEGAIKLMNAELSTNVHFVSRFQAEIDALNKINHPAVIDILDWGCDREGAWYFVMPFIQGSSLRSILSKGPLDGNEVKELLKKLLAGLAACHAQKVIHRDIKPENIMIREDRAPILIDFGIAHQQDVGTGHTQMATGGYAPPEQLAGKQVDGSADLFALGMTIAECLGAKAGEGEWANLINQMTHFMPSARGTAQSLIESLKVSPKKQYSKAGSQKIVIGLLSLIVIVVLVFIGLGPTKKERSVSDKTPAIAPIAQVDTKTAVIPLSTSTIENQNSQGDKAKPSFKKEETRSSISSTQDHNLKKIVPQNDPNVMVSYVARISKYDKQTLSGKTLKHFKHMIGQDRANVHRFNIKDDEDEIDKEFTSRERRMWLTNKLIASQISSKVAYQIKNNNPLIRVTVFHSGLVKVELEEDKNSGKKPKCIIAQPINLDRDGDNFLSVRQKPGSKYLEINRLHSTDEVCVTKKNRKWYNISFKSMNGKNIPCSTGACTTGWVFGKYIATKEDNNR